MTAVQTGRHLIAIFSKSNAKNLEESGVGNGSEKKKQRKKRTEGQKKTCIECGQISDRDLQPTNLAFFSHSTPIAEPFSALFGPASWRRRKSSARSSLVWKMSR